MVNFRHNSVLNGSLGLFLGMDYVNVVRVF